MVLSDSNVQVAGPRKGGGVRFGEDDSLTAAPQQSSMARGGGGAAAVAQSKLGVDKAASLDLPDGEPISDGDSNAEEGNATEAEEELDGSMPRIPGAFLIVFTVDSWMADEDQQMPKMAPLVDWGNSFSEW